APPRAPTRHNPPPPPPPPDTSTLHFPPPFPPGPPPPPHPRRGPPVGGGGGGLLPPPHRRQVGSQRPDRSLVLGRQPGRSRPLPALVLFLQLPLLLQGLFPAALQLTGHEPILRLTRLVLPGGPLGLVRRPLPAQLPLLG